MPIRLNSTGGGAVTITAPYTASTYTLTAPTVTANLITDSANSITQSMMSTGLAGTGPAFSVYLGTNQSVTSSTWIKAQLASEVFDTASCYDNATNYRFTPNVAGYYQINGSIYHNYTASAGVRIGTSIYKNGSSYSEQQITNAGYSLYGTITVSSLIYLNGTTDYVELWGINYSASAQFYGSQVLSYFNGAMMRAA